MRSFAIVALAAGICGGSDFYMGTSFESAAAVEQECGSADPLVLQAAIEKLKDENAALRVRVTDLESTVSKIKADMKQGQLSQAMPAKSEAGKPKQSEVIEYVNPPVGSQPIFFDDGTVGYPVQSQSSGPCLNGVCPIPSRRR